VTVLAAVLAVVTWQVWKSTDPTLVPPEFPTVVSVGVSDGPADTRVYFSYLTTFSDPTSLRVVLGQALASGTEQVRYRIEFSGIGTARASDLPREVPACTDSPPARFALTVCLGQGFEGPSDGTAEVVSDPDNPGTFVLVGEFSSHGETFIDITGLYLGTTAVGPYRLFQQDFRPLDDEAVSDLHFPAGGVEVKPSLDIDSGNRRYDSVTPDPHRLYPDGWSFLIQRPGSPVDIRVTDVDEETDMRHRRDLYAVFTGVFIGLAAEGVMLLVFTRKEATGPTD
jgi:hypothetical protein